MTEYLATSTLLPRPHLLQDDLCQRHCKICKKTMDIPGDYESTPAAASSPTATSHSTPRWQTVRWPTKTTVPRPPKASNVVIHIILRDLLQTNRKTWSFQREDPSGVWTPLPLPLHHRPWWPPTMRPGYNSRRHYTMWNWCSCNCNIYNFIIIF